MNTSSLDVNADSGASRADAGGELDAWTVAAIIWARRRLVLWTTVIVVAIAAAVLFSITPRYSSQAKILIENRESQFTRPARQGEDQFLSDQAAVLSQVEVLSSRDLAMKVIEKLELGRNPEFNSNPAGQSLIGQLLVALGVRKPVLDDATAGRVIEAFSEHLTAFQVGTSRVIAVEFSSADPELAARVANTLTDEYIAVQRVNKFDTNQEAIAWLGREIDQLREKVAEAEANVARYRSETGIFQTERDTSLNEQQLSELNAELIRASAAQSEARTKATLIKQLLEEPGSIEEAADVLNSPLIQRLREQQAAVSREHAELSATLLPGHPRMRELTAELGDLERRILTEARKIARGLENEADLAGARVEAIKKTLAELKIDAGETSQSEIKLRALEREAAAQREILETFLRRYREATTRQDVDVQTADARIISKANVPTSPSYPPRGPILALAAVAGLLLGLMAAIIAEMTSGRREASEPARERRRSVAAEPSAAANDDANSDDADEPEAPPLGPVVLTAVEQTIGRRLSELTSSRAARRIAVLKLSGPGNGLEAACRLGDALAEDGRSPVVVEASIGSGEGESEVSGLFDVLGGEVALGQVLTTAGENGFTLIRSGGRAENTADLLRSGRVSLVIDALLRRFDLALVVAGSLSDGEMPVQLASACDFVLVTVPAREVSDRRMKAAMAELEKSGITQAAIVSVGENELTLYDGAAASRGAVPNAA